MSSLHVASVQGLQVSVIPARWRIDYVAAIAAFLHSRYYRSLIISGFAQQYIDRNFPIHLRYGRRVSAGKFRSDRYGNRHLRIQLQMNIIEVSSHVENQLGIAAASRLQTISSGWHSFNLKFTAGRIKTGWHGQFVTGKGEEL